MNQQYAELFRLTLPERLQLVEDLWDSIAVEARAYRCPIGRKRSLTAGKPSTARIPA